MSTGCREVKQLVAQGMMIVEGRASEGDGKRHAIYKSTFSYVSVELKDALCAPTSLLIHKSSTSRAVIV